MAKQHKIMSSDLYYNNGTTMQQGVCNLG